MNEKFDLIYSSDALLNRVLFLSSEVNIFVEDTDKEYEYEEIFEHISEIPLNISCIFPTGGKLQLEEAYNLFGNDPQFGKCFFIADGDFDLALNKPMITADNFLYLKKYNIESYYIYDEAIILYARPRLKLTKDKTKEVLALDSWFSKVVPFLNELFSLHYIVQKRCSDIKNVSRGPDRFFDGNGFPKEEAFELYKREIGEKVENIDEEIAKAKEKLSCTYGESISSYVCGKYFICALKLMLNTKFSKKINTDELKAGLINNLNSNDLKYIYDKIVSFLKK